MLKFQCCISPAKWRPCRHFFLHDPCLKPFFFAVYHLAFSMDKGRQGPQTTAAWSQRRGVFSDKVPIAKMSTSDTALQVILFTNGEERALLGCMSPSLLQDETNKTWHFTEYKGNQDKQLQCKCLYCRLLCVAIQITPEVSIPLLKERGISWAAT